MDMQTDAAGLSRLAENTARYARYSRSAGGLSLVVGGVLCLAAFVAGATIDLTPAWRHALASTPLAWLLSKELLRARYYQRSGGVLENLSARQLRGHRWMVGYLSMVSALVVGAILWKAGTHAWRWPTIGYLGFVAALPLVAARWFWSVGDFLVGVLLFCQAAVVIGGLHYPWYWVPVAAAYAAIAIRTGWREHRDYQRLRSELGLHPRGARDGLA